MKRIFSVALLASVIGVLLTAQTPTVLSRNNKWPPQGSAFSFGGPFEIYYQAVPTSLTAISTHDAHLIGYCVSNSSGGALTFTIQTADASPLPLPITGSIPALGSAGSSVCFNAPFGLLSKGGFSIQASGSGLYYQLVWTN